MNAPTPDQVRDMALARMMDLGYLPPDPQHILYEHLAHIWTQRFRIQLRAAAHTLTLAHEIAQDELEALT